MRGTGVLVLLVPLLAGIWACPEEAKVHSAVPPGDMSRYDPFMALGAVRDFVGAEAELLSINARFVRSDGSMDLKAEYEPYAAYTFLRKRSTGSDRPVGAGGGASHEKVQIRVGAPGNIYRMSTGSPSVKINVPHKGMVEIGKSKARQKDLKEVLKPPSCTPKALWASAIELGAPKDAVAVIGYGKRGYSFRIQDLELIYNFDFSCKPGREQRAKALEKDDQKAVRKAEKALRKEEKRQKKEAKKREREKRLNP
jgi:hypothetical protein